MSVNVTAGTHQGQAFVAVGSHTEIVDIDKRRNNCELHTGSIVNNIHPNNGNTYGPSRRKVSFSLLEFILLVNQIRAIFCFSLN